jgi:chorismate mutase / prephenate dehydratase
LGVVLLYSCQSGLRHVRTPIKIRITFVFYYIMTSSNSGDNSKFNNELSAFRKQIDDIDDKLIELLIQRIGIVKQVGALKMANEPGKCPIRAGREADMVRRIMKKFEGTAFFPAAAGAIWRTLIGASTSAESQLTISVFAPGQNNDYYWLGREYFGAFNPSIKQPNVKRVIGDVMDGKASVGIIPMPHHTDTEHWWTNLMQPGKDMPRVFAQVPFIYPDSMDKDASIGLAIACIEPEQTADDLTLVVMETDYNVSQHRLQTAFATAKMEARWITIATLTPSSRHHLLEIRGFITPDHSGMKSLLASLGPSSVLQTHYLGSYATPVLMSNSEKKPALHASGNGKK